MITPSGTKRTALSTVQKPQIAEIAGATTASALLSVAGNKEVNKP